MQNQNKDALTEKMQEFKCITEKLLEAVNNDNAEALDNLFIKRQQVINEIEKLEYNKKDFNRVCEELNIVKLSQALEEAFVLKRIETKEKMSSLKEQKTANKSYIQSSNRLKSIFNTKI